MITQFKSPSYHSNSHFLPQFIFRNWISQFNADVLLVIMIWHVWSWGECPSSGHWLIMHKKRDVSHTFLSVAFSFSSPRQHTSSSCRARLIVVFQRKVIACVLESVQCDKCLFYFTSCGFLLTRASSHHWRSGVQMQCIQ